MMTIEHDPFRPTSWNEYIGQESLKERLLVHIDSARDRDARLPHLLLIGPAGVGKTSLARMVAQERQVPFLSYVMPVRSSIIQATMQGFKGVVFLDELHRMKDQEILLPILENQYMQLENGRRLYNTDITFIGATTEGDQIVGPLYDRFMVPPFDPYTVEDMTTIVKNMAAKIDTVLMGGVAEELAVAAAGSPRMAGQFVMMARDLAVTVGADPAASDILRMCRVTSTGLTEDHLRYLSTLNALGGTAGVALIGNHLRLPKDVLMKLERLLVDQGMITYTKSGRSLTFDGSTYLEKDYF